jgi:hypothetical protein
MMATDWLQSQNKSQSYFMTGSLLPISLSWRQAPWDSQPEFFSTEPLRSLSLCNILSDEKMGLSIMNMLGLSLSVHIAHIACYWKFLFLHYIQLLCQYRLCRADHAYLTYLMPQQQLSHLNGRKPGLSLFYFLCLASPCPIPRTCSFSWFCMTSTCCLHSFII